MVPQAIPGKDAAKPYAWDGVGDLCRLNELLRVPVLLGLQTEFVQSDFQQSRDVVFDAQSIHLGMDDQVWVLRRRGGSRANSCAKDAGLLGKW